MSSRALMAGCPDSVGDLLVWGRGESGRARRLLVASGERSGQRLLDLRRLLCGVRQVAVVEQHPERPWHSALGSYQGCASNAGGGGLLAGGFHERNPSEDDVQEIASFAARELRGNLVEVQCPRTQVVAGINYSMTVIVEFPSTDVVRRAFHVVVFKPLPHTGQPPSLKTADDLGAVPVDD